MAQFINEADRQRFNRWILELFSPITEPTRHSAASVRFGLGEFEMPGTIFSRWAIVRGVVWALQEVAPTAWSEIKALEQAAVDGLRNEWATPEEPDRLDQLVLARAAVLCKEEGLSLKIAGLRSVDDETLASARQLDLRIRPNPDEFKAWLARWNLTDDGADRSLFTVALVTEAINETDLARKLPAEVIAIITFGALLESGWMPDPGDILRFKPPPNASREAIVLPPYPQAFRFEYPKFSPFFETAATFKDAARAAFKRELDAHIEACYAALMPLEVAPVPVKRVPDIHFRWYIRYQVLGESISEVAVAECVTAGAVSLALDHVAELAGVPLRESTRGRRRKQQPPSASGISS